VTIGHPALTLLDANGVIFYQDAENDYVRIHNNQIVSNGGLGGAGGGVSLYTGADNYEVTDNLIAGNFTEGEGAGIGHLGRSNGGLVARNRILFNQSFFQQTTVSGGGIFLGGGAALNLGGLTEGTGSVTVDANLIQGNLAGAGDGGGIKVIWSLPSDLVRIANNFIVNNVAGLAGGGIALQDAASVQIVHNTIARNDSTATAGAAFINLNLTAALPAGIAARAPLPSQLVLDSNIIWENRAFHFEISSPTVYGLVLDGFRDLGVLPAGAGTLVPTNSVLTGAAVPFAAPYSNVGRRSVIIFPPTAPLAMPAFDEGGNFIDVRYGPLTAVGSNYHLSSAFGGGTPGQTDVDGDLDNGTAYAGADRFVASSNLVPVAVKDSYELTLPANGRPEPYWVSAPGVLANDYDPDNSGTLSATLLSLTLPPGGTGTLQFNLTTRPANIPVSFVPGPGSFIFTAGQRFEGLVTFTYLLSDGQRASVGTATINVVNPRANAAPAPTAQPINVLPYTGGNPPTVGTTRVLPNDPNVGDTHTFAFVNYQDPNPRNGSATVSAGGTVSYTPDPNFTGTDVVIVRVTDQLGRGANVRIDVIVSLSLAPTQNMQVQMPPDLDGLDTDGDGDPANDNVYVLLGAGDGFSTMADGYQQYIFSFSNLSNLLASAAPTGDPNVKTVPLDRIMEQGMLGANFPAPTLKIKEGQRLYLNLANVGMALRPDLFDPHTVHWHGFPQAAPVFDGVPDASLSINMSANYTFFYDVVFPGTYMYHCHVEATEHMQMGMLGNLFVTPKQDSQLSLYPKDPLTGALYAGFAYNDGDGTTGYDVDYPVQIAGFDSAFHDASLTVQPLPFALMKDRYPMLNGRGYPDTVAQGSLVPPEANTYVEATVLAETPRNPNRFFIDGLMLADTVGAYNGLDLVFSQTTPTVALRGVSRRISTYDFVQENNVPLARIMLESPLPVRPNAGDAFSIGKASQNVSSRIVATKGQKILLRISSLDVTRYYTLASTLPMQIVGLNARLLRGPDPDGAGPLKGSNLYYTTNSVTLGGGESVDAIVDTTNVAPGTYLLYTSNLNYLSNNQEDFGGMMTEIVVNP
jgi:FtsP/CotA-like multicopper oxidase with cupredoxin domain